MSFSVEANREAFVYCFVQDEKTRQIRDILRHGSHSINALPAGQAVPLRPMLTHPIVSQPDRRQTLACFATSTDRSKEVMALFRSGSGAPIAGVTDFGTVKSQLRSGGSQLASVTLSLGGAGGTQSNPADRR